MDNNIRIDKYLSDMGIGSRSEIKNYIKKSRIKVNDSIVTNANQKVDFESDKVYFDNQRINYQQYEYYMLNKPADVISATKDNMHRTVADIVQSSFNNELFPIGRLDIDTEGLLVMTNDGELAHSLLSPKKHVTKKYYVKVSGDISLTHIELFENGLKVDDEFTALPARLEIIDKVYDNGETVTCAYISITEGKFHQIKRMFIAIGMKVIYLKRVSMGALMLDESLNTGEYRELSLEEIELLKKTNR